MEGSTDTHKRADEAKKLWHEGDHAFRQADPELALRFYRAAHDLVRDCPRLHRASHERLAAAHRELGLWTAWAFDNALLVTAPLGSFRIVGAIARKTKWFTPTHW